MDNTQVISILEAAAIRMSQGWVRGVAMAHDGSVCALGAILSVITHGRYRHSCTIVFELQPEEDRLYRHILTVLSTSIGLPMRGRYKADGTYECEGDPCSVASWNDRQTERGPVIAAFMTVAEDLRRNQRQAELLQREIDRIEMNRLILDCAVAESQSAKELEPMPEYALA